MRILLAEDETSLNKLITKTLKKNGYTVDSCFDGKEALYYLSHAEFDAAILDIMMPELSGLEVLTFLRKQGNSLPILLLTARDSIEDRVLGLDSGANDYLIKPFAFEELLARLRVLLRTPVTVPLTFLELADLRLDLSSRRVFRGQEEITLSAKEFSLLEYLIRNAGIVLSREKIEQHIWNYDFEGGSNVIDVYIRYLRKKIDDPYPSKLIHTVRGAGYVLKEVSHDN